MAARKNRKKGLVVLEDMSKPSQWRKQHGAFEPRSFDADPETGAVVAHHRAVDTLGVMLRNGTIGQELYDTGVLFRALFRKAAIDRVMTTAFLRLPGQRVDHLSETSVHARIKIANAMDVLAATTPRSDPVPGTCSAARRRCGSGHCGRAGRAGRSPRRTRRACWWQPSACSRSTSACCRARVRRD